MSTPLVVPPGPTPREMLQQIRIIQKDAPGFLSGMVEQYGRLSTFKVGSVPVYIVGHPDGVKQILQDHHHRYSKDTIQYNSLATITGQGLLTSDGSFWLRQRRLAQPAFARPRLTLLDQIVLPATQEMLDRWQQAAHSGQVIDVDKEMMLLTLVIVGKALFSIDLSREASRLTGAVLTALDHIVYRARNIVVLPDFVPTPRNLRFRRALHTLNEVVYSLVADRRTHGIEKDDLLGMLLKARDEQTGELMSDLQVRDEVMTMLIAGHETVASALTWTWFLLARHPEIRQALHHEVKVCLAGRAPSQEDLPDLSLARSVFSEALRLYPPAWVITRKAVEEDKLWDYPIPPGALMIISPYTIHRLSDFWPDPEKFNPGRFNQETENRHRFAYIPFGAGPRLCIGNQFASIEAQLIMAMVNQNFWLELVGEQEIQMDALVTLRPRNGLPMRVRMVTS